MHSKTQKFTRFLSHRILWHMYGAFNLYNTKDAKFQPNSLSGNFLSSLSAKLKHIKHRISLPESNPTCTRHDLYPAMLKTSSRYRIKSKTKSHTWKSCIPNKGHQPCPIPPKSIFQRFSKSASKVQGTKPSLNQNHHIYPNPNSY